MRARGDICGWRLYGIIDLGYVPPAEIERAALGLIDGGIDVIQLRAKGCGEADVEALARRLRALTAGRGVPFLVNDHARVAVAVDADGVHVGQDDLSPREARAIVGRERVIGLSTHSLEQARAARDSGADYIGYGPIYATGTKPDYAPIGAGGIAAAQGVSRRPTFCIGGIDPDNLDVVLRAGARRVVMVSALLRAPDIAGAVRAVKARLSWQG